MKTKEDVLAALKKVNFLERTAELAQNYKRDPKGKKTPSIKREIVFEIIKKYGYVPGYSMDEYVIKKIDGAKERSVINFSFHYSWVIFIFLYSEGKSFIYSGKWGKIKKDLSGDDDYRTGSPAFSSYEDLEEILAEAISIYEDSVKALYENE